MTFDAERARAIIAERGQKAVDAPADTPPSPPIPAPNAGGEPQAKETQMAETETPDLAAIQAEANAKAKLELKERRDAVKASTGYAGNKALADDMLDDTDLSAQAIIALIAKQPAPAPATSAQDEADAAAMLAAIKAGNAPPLGSVNTEAPKSNAGILIDALERRVGQKL